MTTKKQRQIQIRFHLMALLLSMIAVAGCSFKSVDQDRASTRIANKAAEFAMQMRGSPYRYGGNTPRGFDCSGLVYYSYQRAGMKVSRSTRSQRRNSKPISRERMRRGDLLFFDQEGRSYSHVAIYLGGNRFIHAPSTGKRVRTASLSNPYWRKHFRGARRFDFD